MSGRLSVPLSVLDLCPVPIGESAAEALRRSVDLVQHAERWGMRRYWVAEHHSMPGTTACRASPAPRRRPHFRGRCRCRSIPDIP
ncbi:MAG TPA: hypothetical protein VMC83_36065 [Streptosporangiaceae bacterium]|nr:hypothetical protein [Streptosporangiaceae bacterium]